MTGVNSYHLLICTKHGSGRSTPLINGTLKFNALETSKFWIVIIICGQLINPSIDFTRMNLVLKSFS